jgi:hypothetical protein
MAVSADDGDKRINRMRLSMGDKYRDDDRCFKILEARVRLGPELFKLLDQSKAPYGPAIKGDEGDGQRQGLSCNNCSKTPVRASYNSHKVFPNWCAQCDDAVFEHYVDEFSNLPPLVGELIQAALQRQRCRLTLETVYKYDQLVHFLRELDSNWNVYVPPVLGGSALSAAWPKKEHVKATLAWLTSNGCRNAQDVLDGACVPLARLCDVQTCQLLLAGKQPAEVATEVHSSCLQRLRGLSPDGAAELVFTELKQWEWKVSQKMWDCDLKEHELVFGCDTVGVRLKHALKHALEQSKRQTLPLYILCYIFDADELTDESMKLKPDEETAQYSIHAVSLVIDPASKSILVADPNGALVEGSNMEFVRMPPKIRRANPSTTTSRFDLDQKRLASKRKRTSI